MLSAGMQLKLNHMICNKLGCRWNFVAPGAININNDVRHQIIRLFHHYHVYEISVLETALERSNIFSISEMKRNRPQRSLFLQQHPHLKTCNEDARKAVLKKCVPFSFTTTATETTQTLVEASGLNILIGGFIGATNDYISGHSHTGH